MGVAGDALNKKNRILQCSKCGRPRIPPWIRSHQADEDEVIPDSEEERNSLQTLTGVDVEGSDVESEFESLTPDLRVKSNDGCNEATLTGMDVHLPVGSSGEL